MDSHPNHNRVSSGRLNSRPPACPLCSSNDFSTLTIIKSKTYKICRECTLVFLSPEDRLKPEAERSRYLLHENHPGDPDYRNFLDRLAVHLIPKLVPGSAGLDYGSGPGPTLSIMLEERGFRMEVYDPFFTPKTTVLNRQYDFVTCTETLEHFYHPGKEFQKLNDLIKPGGWLGGMTSMLDSDEKFPDWHYHREPTHVCFYKKATMDWIAHRFNWRAEFPAKNIVLFQKGPAVQTKEESLIISKDSNISAKKLNIPQADQKAPDAPFGDFRHSEIPKEGHKPQAPREPQRTEPVREDFPLRGLQHCEVQPEGHRGDENEADGLFHRPIMRGNCTLNDQS